MKKTVCALALLAAMGVAHAKDETALAKESGCMSCHAMAEKVVGPAFAAVAEKYKGDKGAHDDLVQSIRNGSKGKWGRAAMPGHGNLSNEQISALVSWVLSVK